MFWCGVVALTFFDGCDTFPIFLIYLHEFSEPLFFECNSKFGCCGGWKRLQPARFHQKAWRDTPLNKSPRHPGSRISRTGYWEQAVAEYMSMLFAALWVFWAQPPCSIDAWITSVTTTRCRQSHTNEIATKLTTREHNTCQHSRSNRVELLSRCDFADINLSAISAINSLDDTRQWLRWGANKSSQVPQRK